MKREKNTSNSRVFDDGHQDAKAGRAPLPDQLFESKVDYQIYKSGFDSFKKESNPKVTGTLDLDSFCIRLDDGDSPFLNASGIGISEDLMRYIIPGSGKLPWHFS